MPVVFLTHFYLKTSRRHYVYLCNVNKLSKCQQWTVNIFFVPKQRYELYMPSKLKISIKEIIKIVEYVPCSKKYVNRNDSKYAWLIFPIISVFPILSNIYIFKGSTNRRTHLLTSNTKRINYLSFGTEFLIAYSIFTIKFYKANGLIVTRAVLYIYIHIYICFSKE